MKEYFELRYRNRDQLGSLYSLNLLGDSIKLAEVKDSIKAGVLDDGAEVLMEIDSKSGTGKKRLGDVVFWQKGNPSANVLIISDRVLEFFMTLDLPEHKVYKIIISDQELLQYYVFHLLGDVWSEIDYSRQIFYKRNMTNDSNEGYLDAGLFINKEDFLHKRADLMAMMSQTLFFETVVYRKEYDVMWGFSTKILVNGMVKKKMEELRFVLDFVEFKTYKIVYS